MKRRTGERERSSSSAMATRNVSSRRVRSMNKKCLSHSPRSVNNRCPPSTNQSKSIQQWPFLIDYQSLCYAITFMLPDFIDSYHSFNCRNFIIDFADLYSFTFSSAVVLYDLSSSNTTATNKRVIFLMNYI